MSAESYADHSVDCARHADDAARCTKNCIARKAAANKYSPVIAVEPLPDTAFNRRMAQGHKARLGHKLIAEHVSADRILWHTVRLCCGDTVPARVSTWAAVVPVMEVAQ